jgi:hypothetical protein
MASTETLVGIPAVRLESALPVQEQIALRDALCDWRLQLIGRIRKDQYPELVKRHVRVVADPGRF